MAPYAILTRPSLDFAKARRAERAELAGLVVCDPVCCVAGRVYARRTVRRADARRSDRALDQATRWC